LDATGQTGSTVVARETLVVSTWAAGVSIACGSTGRLERSLVRDTRTWKGIEAGVPVEGYGDGIGARACIAPVMPGFTTAPPTLDLLETVVDRSARAGLVFYGAGGSVRRSAFRRGILAVDLDGSNPKIGDDNLYEGNVEDRVTFGNNLAPSPPPKVPPLLPPPEH
jgi:hypothetical protein